MKVETTKTRSERFLRREASYKTTPRGAKLADLATRHVNGERGLEGEIIACSEGLVKRYVAQFAMVKSTGFDHEELFQECYLAILEALRTYVPSKGSFSLHLLYRCRHRVRQFVDNCLSVAHISRHVHVLINSNQTVEKDGRFEVGGFSAPTQLVNRARAARRGSECLDDISSSHFAHTDTAVLNLEHAERDARVRALLKYALPSEFAVLIRWFGIDVEPQTLAQISEDLGVTRQRVSKIKENALRRIRSNMTAREYDVLSDAI